MAVVKKKAVKKKAAKKTTAKKGAKRKSASAKAAKQLRIEGTYEPLPDGVEEKVDHFVAVVRQRKSLGEEENVLRQELLALLTQHGITSIPIDDGKKQVAVVDDVSHKLKIIPRKEG